jgi:Family of unknown function (DUF5872)
MAETARRTDPKLWETVKAKVTAGEKGGHAGQWSARKAQFAVQEYKRRGGGYEGGKQKDNSLKQWTEEDWGTKSGKKSTGTGERYLPKEARESLTKEEYDRTTAKKRSDTRKGKQFSSQPRDVAEKTGKHRGTGKSG